MAGRLEISDLGFDVTQLAAIGTVAELATALRQLRRRHARRLGDSPLTYRELATKTGWAHGVIGGYFTGQTLAPTDRFDVLVDLLGATDAERHVFATARDRVEELRRNRDRPASVVPVVPRELPSDVDAFTGRAAQLAELNRLLDDTDTPAVVIWAVAGTAGVGKTALAVHWAHRVSDRFPDGCLYVDLRGNGPDRPLRPDDALGMLLRSLGVPDASVPVDSAERATRYRTMMANRRMLILLDNANGAAQVRPLFPGTPSCRTIITSRDHLAGLVARDSARRIDLDTLPDNESRQLVAALIGARALSEPDSTRALAGFCCGLPLALRVAAEYAIARPEESMAELVAELADQRRRLDVLDEGTAIRAVFSWSYRALSPDTARAFRLFGLHPGRHLDDHGLAALVGTSVARARQLAAQLTRAFLVRPVGDGRYAMHDLLRAHAAELAATDLGRGPARTRLYEYYVHTAGVAAMLLYPADRPQRPPLRPVTTDVPALADVDEALAWLDAERDNIVSAVIAAATDSPRHAVDLALTVARYLHVGNHNADSLLMHGHARAAARGHGDRTGEANVLRYRGLTQNVLTNFPLALDHPERLEPQLRDLIARHPLREHLHAQLMLALARSGCQAEALAACQVLVDQVGIEPGPELRSLQERILARDGDVFAPPRGATSEPAPATAMTPRQLPAAPRLFTGRTAELAALTKALDTQADIGATLVISAIGGAAGIGKTWLALHWAHHNIDRFPDGQLYVDLRGFDPHGQPMPAERVVRGFLDALGVAAIPPDPQAQVGLYRSLLVDRRVLIVADNAREAAQVIPLLPGGSACTVLVTSRRRLTGLVSGHGAVPVDLDVLPDHEARRLLARHLGRTRLRAEPDAVTTLLGCCAGLPLAISIVAARALTHPDLPLTAVADELRDTTARLDALATGDLTANVRATLSWSYDALSPEAARALGLLAAAPGPDIGLPATASLTTLPSDRVRLVLRELEDAFLLQQHTPGRYRLHDLIRLYAADHEHTPAEREEALRRVVDFYLRTAHAADRLLAPHRVPIRLDPPPPGARTHELSDAPSAVAWFQAEHANLLAAQQTATTHYWHLTVWQLAAALDTFHFRQGRIQDVLAVWQAALDAAAHLPDPTTRTRAHRLLGRAYSELERHRQATGHLHQALVLAEQQRDPTQQAHTHLQLAWAWDEVGDDQKALHHATCALNLHRALDLPVWKAHALNLVGWCAARLGEHDTARTHCQAALTLFQHHHHPDGQATTLDSLGYIEHHTGHHHQAIHLYQQALTLRRSAGNTYASATTLDALGHSHAALGQHQQARAVWQQALELYQTQRRDNAAERVRQHLAQTFRVIPDDLCLNTNDVVRD